MAEIQHSGATQPSRRRAVAVLVALTILTAIPLLAPSDRSIPARAADSTSESDGQPALTVVPEQIQLYGVVGETDPPPVHLTIEGASEQVNWEASEDADWLYLDQASGATPAETTLLADFSKLPAGEHQAMIVFQPGNIQVPISVELQEPKPHPTVTVEPVSLSFDVTSGDTTSEQEIEVNGEAEAAWSAVTSAPWLRLSTYSGKVPSTVRVSILPDGLEAGDYQGTIWLGQETIDVSLSVAEQAAEDVEPTIEPAAETTPEPTVAPSPTPQPSPTPSPTPTPEPLSLTANPASLSFTVMTGQTTAAQRLTIGRASGEGGDWTATTDAAWLTLSQSGVELPATVDVTVDAASLPPGEHATVIQAGNLTIPVTVTVLDQSRARAAIEEVWTFSDYPVAEKMAERTWLWGPAPLLETQEPYAEAPGGQRLVVYYDKGRMEVTDPGADVSSLDYVTNGLLAKEMITGKIQVGDNSFEQKAPAQIPVAGDLDDPDSPRYASFTDLVDAPPLRSWSIVTQTLNAAGEVGDNPDLAYHGVIVTEPDPITNHTVASVFLEYFLSGGAVWKDGGLTWAPYFKDWHNMIGLPITEPFWSQVTANDEEINILIQCFERRCLTWSPSYEEGWQVEQANVGQHYLQWRYNGAKP